MKWSSESVLLMILIHFAVLSDSRSKAEINFLNRYVTPNRIVRCFNGQLPCQTLEQYATRPEMYFMNNTCFYFQPGNHQLNDILLNLRNLRNVIFKGLPNNKVEFSWIHLLALFEKTAGLFKLLQLISYCQIFIISALYLNKYN